MSVGSEELFKFVQAHAKWSTRETDEGPAQVAPALSGEDLAQAMHAVVMRAEAEGNYDLNAKALDYQHPQPSFSGPQGVPN